jgi:uncharacterized protein
MLTSTFLHAQGIGPTTERRLWEAGYRTWQDALSAGPKELPLTAAQRALLLPTLEASMTALEQDDWKYFAETMPSSEHWRAAPQFMERIGFLDIETNGGFGADDITIIGVYDGYESRIYVKDRDLEEFEAATERVALWVTFFGTGFDLPFLRRRFPNLPLNQMHIDLCSAMRRIGYKGGLKRIEEKIGVARPPEVSGMSGFDAVRLWRQYRRRNDEDALNLLIAYNRAVIENLQLLLAFAYPRLREHAGFPESSAAASTNP